MTDLESRQLDEINTLSIMFRGSILNACIGLEKTIDDFIAKDISFDEKTQLRIFSILLDRMTFESKITAFTAILDEAQDLAGFKKTKTKGYPHKELVKNLRIIKDERNYFAHQSAWLQAEAIRYYPQVAFVNFRDKTKIELYNNERATKMIEFIYKITKEINNLIIGMQPS
jgi:hypothetical protein